MTAHDPQLHRPKAGILSWLGLSRDAEAEAAAPQPSDSGEEVPDPVRAARLRHVADIGRFLSAQELEVSPFTLAIAHDFLTGEDPQMARAIEARIKSGEPITVEWLENAGRDQGTGGERRALNVLMTRLETNLDEFSRSSSAAKNAATDYSSALETQVTDLSNIDNAGEVISELANLASAMLNRTRELEKEMSRSELQAKSLRRNLDQAKRSAEEDHLTGLPNRRGFDAMMAKEHAAAQAAREHLCVAFCDIDHFKRINDTFGHNVGDEVLREFALRLATNVRGVDLACRYGGEEFVVIMPDTAMKDALRIAERLRLHVAGTPFRAQGLTEPLSVTISVGVACTEGGEDSTDALLKMADEAVYDAKAHGRTQVVCRAA